MTPGVDNWLTYAFQMATSVAPDAFSFRGTLLAPDVLVKRLAKTHRAARTTYEQTSGSRLGDDQKAAAQFWGSDELRVAYDLAREPAFENVQIVAARKSDGIGTDRDESFTDQLKKTFGLQWSELIGRQDTALFSMFPCSPAKLPSQSQHAVSLSFAAHMGLGDDPSMGDKKGVFIGQTSNGRPVYVDYLAAASADSPPSTVIVGSSGSGKTALAQMLAFGAKELGIRGAYINPKGLIDPLLGLHALVDANVAWLSDAERDGSGALDYFRWIEDKQLASDKAFDYLYSVLGIQNGEHEMDFRTALQAGMQEAATAGVESVGEALKYVVKIEPRLKRIIKAQWDSSSLFRLAVGKPGSEGTDLISRSEGNLWTVVEMNRELNLDGDNTSLQGRLARATMRLIVESTYQHLARQGGGILIVDEFHVMLNDPLSRAAFDRINRLARSERVMPVFLSQFPKDFADELGNSDWQPSRKIALRQKESKDAEQAIRFIGMEPTDDRIEALMSANADRETGKPPWGFMSDVQGRTGRVTMGPYPQWFLKKISTNPNDNRDESAA